MVLTLGLSCREPAGVDLIAFLRRAAPFYKSLQGVNVRLHRSLDRPGHFTEIIEYATEEVFHADRARLANDTRMQGLLRSGLIAFPGRLSVVGESLLGAWWVAHP